MGVRVFARIHACVPTRAQGNRKCITQTRPPTHTHTHILSNATRTTVTREPPSRPLLTTDAPARTDDRFATHMRTRANGTGAHSVLRNDGYVRWSDALTQRPAKTGSRSPTAAADDDMYVSLLCHMFLVRVCVCEACVCVCERQSVYRIALSACPLPLIPPGSTCAGMHFQQIDVQWWT